ncbi:dual specificity protein phosphatase family protein [Hymenobacter sp. DH14]|uniref:protein-tyrosine-phosphatase n=1 Tax=Hymenobacter cyanobacteriorum TaxID=2926463 RepID=A0A9X1VGS9_9BACT|nr:dual specificity protein phosphatase family protein [Hymenobacter cyanobacteriorum]MCI1187922.1 dual specificity protein phosphatase family protein [Hymenobacter cyanobacteriorum]
MSLLIRLFVALSDTRLAVLLARPAALVPGTAVRRPWWRAVGWLAVLGPFFFLSYGFANWWTGRLPHVGAVVFGWERHIPFVPWTIVPYMSLDAFYAGSLLLCATRAELDTHARRLLAASIISVAGFLLFPLQFSFVRPATSGFSGALFEVLMGFDKPYNQAPSLHISLVILVWLVFARHLRGAARWVMHGWFSLIAVSVFTTFQHHFIDGVAGAAVAVVVVYLLPDVPHSWQPAPAPANAPRRHHLAATYLLGAACCLGLAAALGGWAWLLLWPGAALLLVGLAYSRFGVSIFQKQGGQLSWAAGWLLLPYRVGAWLSSRWFTRREAPAAEVVPGLWLGRAPGRADRRHLPAAAILDLTAEFNRPAAARHRPYRSVPLLDLVVPTPAELAQAVAALDALWPARPVLVHCALGYSRAAVVVAAWLLHRGLAATPEAAVAQVRAARPQVVLSGGHCAALAAYGAVWCPQPVLAN